MMKKCRLKQLSSDKIDLFLSEQYLPWSIALSSSVNFIWERITSSVVFIFSEISQNTFLEYYNTMSRGPEQLIQKWNYIIFLDSVMFVC